MQAKGTEYIEIAKTKVAKRRNVVVSHCSKGGFTVAQQLEAEEDGKTTCVFLKGAIHVDDVQGLYNMRDALNIAIAAAEDSGHDSGDTDEYWDAALEDDSMPDDMW